MQKKIFKKIVIFTLLITMFSSSPLSAFAKNENKTESAEDRGDAGGKGQTEIKDFDKTNRPIDAHIKQQDIGFRVYVTDKYGNVKQTDNGEDAIDFLYKKAMDTYYNEEYKDIESKGYLRCTSNAKRSYTIGRENIKDLGFDANYISPCPNIHGGSGCKCTEEYYLDRYGHGIYGPDKHPLRQKLFIDKVGDEVRAIKLLKQYWYNSYTEYINNMEAQVSGGGTISEDLYIHVELVFGIVHHVTNPNKADWYGTVFEFGCDGYRNPQYMDRLVGNTDDKYIQYEEDYFFYVGSLLYMNQPFDCFKDLPYMGSAPFKKGVDFYEMQYKAYGLYSMSFNNFVKIDIETPKTEIPVSPDVEVKKDTVTTIEKVENEDVEVRTGYAAQNGFYNIGTAAGIPTTEEIRNVIEAQDCIIDYGYVLENYSPVTQPKVTYTLDYYIPCTCDPVYRTEYYDELVGYDEVPRHSYDIVGGKRVPCTHYRTEPVYEERSRQVLVYPYGYHGASYHKASEDYNGQSPYVQEVTINRNVQYYRITDYRIYSLDTVFIQNQCSSVNYGPYNPISGVRAIISGKENPNDIVNVALDTHADYSQVRNLTFNHNEVNGGIFQNKDAAVNWVNANGITFGNEKVAVPKAANDRLEITFSDGRGTVLLMDNKWCERESMDATNTVITPAPVTKIAAKAAYQKIIKDNKDNLEIPYGLMNGNYSTSISCIYYLQAGLNKYPTLAVYDYEASNGHIVNENIDLKVSVYNSSPSVSYASQEPIHIITPIISPFHTNDSDKLTPEETAGMTPEEIIRENLQRGTQLVNEADCQQLRIDETYMITFDPAMHREWLGYGYSGLIDNDNYWNGYGEEETDNKYDKYVSKKLLKFPFDVYIQNKLFAANTWISVYEYNHTTGVVSAGDLDEPKLRDVEYYIPSWALSSMESYKNGRGLIETRVLALNYNGNAEHQETYNPNDPQTWSSNAVDVQLSGWVYDFKITGTSDKTPWVSAEENKEYVQDMDDTSISFSDRKEEFFMGIFNRLGQDNTGKDKAQRRDKDDTLDESISEQTGVLPLSFGSSKYGVEQGTIGLGTEISFTLKTMDNLTDKDKIVITPSFTYYSSEKFSSS